MSTIPNNIIDTVKRSPLTFAGFQEHHNNLEFCKWAIELNNDNIAAIAHPSDELVKYILDQNPYNITKLRNPSYNQVQYAVRLSGDEDLIYDVENYLELDLWRTQTIAKLNRYLHNSSTEEWIK